MGPQSENVTEGTTVIFKCLTSYGPTDVFITLSLFTMGVKRSGGTIDGGVTPGGGREVNTTLEATAETNETIVICQVNNRTHPSHFE